MPEQRTLHQFISSVCVSVFLFNFALSEFNPLTITHYILFDRLRFGHLVFFCFRRPQSVFLRTLIIQRRFGPFSPFRCYIIEMIPIVLPKLECQSRARDFVPKKSIWSENKIILVPSSFPKHTKYNYTIPISNWYSQLQTTPLNPFGYLDTTNNTYTWIYIYFCDIKRLHTTRS